MPFIIMLYTNANVQECQNKINTTTEDENYLCQDNCKQNIQEYSFIFLSVNTAYIHAISSTKHVSSKLFRSVSKNSVIFLGQHINQVTFLGTF